MHFKVQPLSGDFISIDAGTAASRALSLLRARRFRWLVTKLDGKRFVHSARDAQDLLERAQPSANVAEVLRLISQDPSVVVKSASQRIELAEKPKSATAASRVVVVKNSAAVSAIGKLVVESTSKVRVVQRAARKMPPIKKTPLSLPVDSHLQEGISFGFTEMAGVGETTARKPAASAHTFEVMDVFYATDRELVAHSSDRSVRYLNRLPKEEALSYGVCRVTIPARHRLGQIESPSIWSFEMRADPEKHFTIRSCLTRAEPAFFEELQARILEGQEKHCFVFIHGYNVCFEDAAKRTAQLACDLKFLGTPILYSWASAADFQKYSKDVESIDLTIDRLSGFLTRLVQSSGAKSIHLIAHSMGNRALVKALKQMALPAGKKPFQQVVLTAPDVPRQGVEPLIEAARRRAERVTLYASSKDKALGLSRTKNDYERLGKVYGYPFVFQGMDSIDASAVKTDFWAHSVFAKTRTVLGDLAALIADGHPPERRFGLKRVVSSEGVCWAILN